uniref:Uncharacterized protein n=1 Tax=Arundo donax TaxID=35708 RepID=A0A0A9BYA9_ARUDO
MNYMSHVNKDLQTYKLRKFVENQKCLLTVLATDLNQCSTKFKFRTYRKCSSNVI